MPRPRLIRRVNFDPDVTYYKPRGVPIRDLEEVTLCLDGMEALRLCDGEGMNQSEAAKKMGVSQPTLYRVLNGARKKIAKALVEGKAIRIDKCQRLNGKVKVNNNSKSK